MQNVLRNENTVLSSRDLHWSLVNEQTMRQLLADDGGTPEDIALFFHYHSFEPLKVASVSILLQNLAAAFINSLRDEMKPMAIETRTPFKITQKDGKIVALGLAVDEDDVERILQKQGVSFDDTYTLQSISPIEYNEYIRSGDYPTWHIIGI